MGETEGAGNRTCNNSQALTFSAELFFDSYGQEQTRDSYTLSLISPGPCEWFVLWYTAHEELYSSW